MTEPFQPPAPAPVNPDDALQDLEASFQGVSAPADVVVVEEQPPPLGLSWAYDFPRERFLLAQGQHGPLTTHGTETLIGWMEKVLRTSRGAHPIHPPGYGVLGRNELIARLVEGAPVAEFERRIRDALKFHPRISDVQDFDYSFDPNDEWVAISFTVIREDDTRLPVATTLSLLPNPAV